MNNQEQQKNHDSGQSELSGLVRTGLRDDLMNAIQAYRERQEENSQAQDKTTLYGLNDAVRYMIRAEAADTFAMIVHQCLQKHGM